MGKDSIASNRIFTKHASVLLLTCNDGKCEPFMALIDLINVGQRF